MCFRCNNNAQFFHYVERFSLDPARGVEFDCHERVGRSLHVLHIRFSVRIRVRQLRRKKTSPTQRRLPPRGKSRHAGEITFRVHSNLNQFSTRLNVSRVP